MRKNAFRAFGLGLLAALGLMAFSASAQALPTWMVNGGNLEIGEAEVQSEGIEGGDGKLLARVGNMNIEILCTGMTLEEAVLKSAGKSLGYIKFTGCIFKANAVHLAVCDPIGGEILTNKLKDEIDLHPAVSAVEGYDRLLPETGSTFAIINTNAECSFGEGEIPVTGSATNPKFTVKDCQNEFRVEKLTHLVEEFVPLSGLFILGTVPATIDGSSNIKLAGADTGKNWSGLPA